jgi:hypothetical protein
MPMGMASAIVNPIRDRFRSIANAGTAGGRRLQVAARRLRLDRLP